MTSRWACVARFVRIGGGFVFGTLRRVTQPRSSILARSRNFASELATLICFAKWIVQHAEFIGSCWMKFENFKRFNS